MLPSCPVCFEESGIGKVDVDELLPESTHRCFHQHNHKILSIGYTLYIGPQAFFSSVIVISTMIHSDINYKAAKVLTLNNFRTCYDDAYNVS